MCAHDIAATLQELNMLDMNTADDVVLSIDTAVVDRHMKRIGALGGSGGRRWLVIEEECLKWTPVVSGHLSSSPEKSSSSPEKQSVRPVSRCSVLIISFSSHLLPCLINRRIFSLSCWLIVLILDGVIFPI